MLSTRVAIGLGLIWLFVAAAFAASEDGTLVFEQNFLLEKIGTSLLALPGAVKSALNGTLQKQPATTPKKLRIECLNSVAPEPLNWKMWCPDDDATVTEWVDDAGATHRKIVLNPMKNMTAKMAVWFMTPAFPETLVVNGKEFHKHVLWHPLDHYTPLKFRIIPGDSLLEPPQLQSRLAEKYRPLPGAPDRGYRTDLWVTASDLALNLPRNRYVLYFGAMGFQAFTLLVQFEDTPEGLVVSVEVVLGAAALGYDKKNPIQGVPKPVAAAANAMLFETVMKPYRDNGDYNAAMDAVTRHVVEEFSNMQRFVPLAWEQQGPGAVLKQLQEFASTMSAATSKLPLAQLARAYMYKTYSASLAGQ